MRSTRLLSVIVSNLHRSREHVLLASIGIVVGIATFTFFTALGLGVRDVVLGKIFPLDQLEVIPKNLDVDVGPLRMGLGADAIDDKKVAELAAIPGVTHAYPKMRLTTPATAHGGRAIVGSNLRSEIVADGIEPELVRSDVRRKYSFEDLESEPSQEQRACARDDECGTHEYCGKPSVPLDPTTRLPREALDGPAQVCRAYVPVLASYHVIELYNGALRRAHRFPKINPNSVLGFTFEMTIGASMVQASNKPFVFEERGMLVGFSSKAIPLGVTIPIGYTKRFNVAFGAPEDAQRFHSVMLIVPDKRDVAQVAKAVQDLNLQVADSGAEQAAVLIAIMMAVFGLVSAVIVGIAAVNIMHVFLMLVYERQHEIGIMRAVGASRGDIARIILGEAALLGALAGITGLALAWGAASLVDWISVAHIPDFPYKPTSYFAFPYWLPASALLFSVVFCVLGALLPARRAATMEPARILSGR